ncbi:mannose-1-phosphate guanylyltransferase [Thermosporothrix hazakensis]|jgi:mannose-1-phosphate guanylyltransferase|uniref:mannose-1-phosphate guanylyltransferase n=1 Tax=Thermosporothrix hazakensis TaxID=644383 RepID=A0A326UDK4_THEHA|nr:mannose-1-phosphate guanylyltransferase [Thermosporothrix hazakensis]PZW36015.1 mannose-1-phosphate guanylyltransferase [Thermosporothrix hazakensis]GCE46667.1 mannose-1-phosphate guanylyltransferase [Thermosporothrix hazakensis]
MEHFNAVILAGGSGTRLWPLSTPSFPKQFLPLPNGNSMIQETLERVAPLTCADQTWIVTGQSMADLAQEHLPSVPPEHVLREPMGRGSAAAIGWAAAVLARQDPDAVLAIFSADHVIANVETFRQSLQLAYEWALQGSLVTIGITPTKPETGYGYIRFAEKLGEGHGHTTCRAERFVEKPDLETAKSYLADGHYVWNAGIFIWKASTFMAEMHEHLPDSARKLEAIADAMGTANEQHVLEELWPTLQNITVDYGILEKTRNLVVIPADLGWCDVGNWEQYGMLFPADEQGVRSVGHHQGFGSQNVVVYNNTGRRVYTIGVEDLIVVEMDDMTVICHKKDVQRVRELAEHHHKNC